MISLRRRLHAARSAASGRVAAFVALSLCMLPLLLSTACNTEAFLESKTSIYNTQLYAYGD